MIIICDQYLDKMTSWIEIPDAQLHTFWPVENIGMVNRTGVTSLDQCKSICEGLSDCNHALQLKFQNFKVLNFFIIVTNTH